MSDIDNVRRQSEDNKLRLIQHDEKLAANSLVAVYILHMLEVLMLDQKISGVKYRLMSIVIWTLILPYKLVYAAAITLVIWQLISLFKLVKERHTVAEYMQNSLTPK